jgi:hypothetical protein
MESMKSLVLSLALFASLLESAPVAPAARLSRAADTFHFTGVTLTDGAAVYEGAEIYVRVKDSAGGGYTRADYLDRDGRRLGFYEAFEVVSRDEAVLREWAVGNFPDRTSRTR